MIIGDKENFGYECYHDPLKNERRRVFGRMCVWAAGQVLGDISEPACMLNVTEGHLQSLLARMEALDEPLLSALGAREAFDFLDRALYLDDDRSNEQVTSDAERFFKFDFLTNGGESFDRTKSFIHRRDSQLRILFVDDEGGFNSVLVGLSAFTLATKGFLAWVSAEGDNAG
ncbi:MAG: Imm42 family immunity protein [Fluviicoccus sp.]|uniref:Imm42 family immunity protein n=1 Tax=Fluviicoccus sp. TaxID=2003552 RepID=UPI002718E59C|nr:Imm42 family immunity protein [Fluviicoccus sp.]MDO8330678.1 Imm42 family immunity protein [Fluviicoccus sp.]